MTEKEMYNLINSQNGQSSNGFAVNEKERGLSGVFSALMRKVYTWMTLALVITGVTAYGVASSPTLLMTLMTSRGLLFGLIIAELALVIHPSRCLEPPVAEYRHSALHHLLSTEWSDAIFGICSIYNDQHCQSLLHHRRHIRSDGLLRIHHQEGSHLSRQDSLYGPDWSDYRHRSQYVPEEFRI
mgnify:CR=1 FL=1